MGAVQSRNNNLHTSSASPLAQSVASLTPRPEMMAAKSETDFDTQTTKLPHGHLTSFFESPTGEKEWSTQRGGGRKTGKHVVVGSCPLMSKSPHSVQKLSRLDGFWQYDELGTFFVNMNGSKLCHNEHDQSHSVGP